MSVIGSAVTTTHLVGVGAFAAARSTCSRKVSALAKNSGASAEKHQPVNQPRVLIPRNIAVTFQAIDMTQHGIVWSPSSPNKGQTGQELQR